MEKKENYNNNTEDYIAKTISRYLFDANEAVYKKRCFEYEKLLHAKETTAEAREKDLREKIDSLYERINSIQENQITFNEKEIKYQNEIKRLEDGLKNANDQVASNLDKLNSFEELVPNYQSEIKRLEDELAKVNEDLANIPEAATDENVAISNEELERLISSSEKYEEYIDELTKKNDELTKERDILKAEYEKLQLAFSEYRDNSGNATKEEIENYRYLAYNDRKIGVKNKNAFNEAIRNIDKDYMSFIMINISDMRRANELSRANGDKKVKEIADALKSTFSGNGEVYRLVGDEFGILTTLNKLDSEDVLKNILSNLADGTKFAYGISEGKEAKSLNEFVKAAENAMIGNRSFNKLPVEEQQLRLNVQKNAAPKTVIVEETESKLQKVEFDENDDEEFADEIAG